MVRIIGASARRPVWCTVFASNGNGLSTRASTKAQRGAAGRGPAGRRVALSAPIIAAPSAE